MKVTSQAKIKSNGYYMSCSSERKDEHITLWPVKRDPMAETFQGKAVTVPIGYSIADFIDADDSFVRDSVSEAQTIAKETNASDPIVYSDELAVRLDQLRTRLWDHSAIFGALVSELFSMAYSYRRGKQYDISRLDHMAEDYLALRDRLRNIVTVCFEWDEPIDLRERYLELQARNVSGFTPLTFGNVTLDQYCYLVEDAVVPALGAGSAETDFNEIVYMKEKTIPTEVLKTECMEDMVNFLIYKYLNANLRMKKCKYCGRYFGSVDNYHSEYCIRRIEGSSGSCRSLGAVKLYEQKIFESPAVREYKRSYKAHNSRVRHGTMAREDFKKWSAEARAMRDKCIAGEITLEELIAWLDSDKLR